MSSNVIPFKARQSQDDDPEDDPEDDDFEDDDDEFEDDELEDGFLDGDVHPGPSIARQKSVDRMLCAANALNDKGEISGAILIAISPTGHFLTDVAIDFEKLEMHLFAFVGALEAMKNEISDRAMMSPYMDPSGKKRSPSHSFELATSEEEK